MDESTLRDSETILMTYVKYVDNDEFNKEMLVCETLKTTITAFDIYNKLKIYLDETQIQMRNITSCADGAPAIMGKKCGCLKLMKDDNTEMMLAHCVIYRENLVSEKLSPSLNEIIHSVIKCINFIKANAKYERFFKLFCEDKNAEHNRLLLHTEIRLSQGNCLKRFLELFDFLGEFLNDKLKMILLKSVNSQAFLSYLTEN
ncbi:protein FAM200A-like [Centruroides vittatus]|uniref:protein FAM200A-like n=1 Tax=Centruroides vittatus TaxID=120091 RepID=UPI00350EBA14